MEELDSNLEFEYSDFYYEKYCLLVQEYLHQVILHQVTIDSKNLHISITDDYIPNISSSIVDIASSAPFVNAKGELCMATHIVLTRKGIHIPIDQPNMILLRLLFNELYIIDRNMKYIDLYGAPIDLDIDEDQDPFRLLCNDSDSDFLDFIDDMLPELATTYLLRYKYCLNHVKLLSVLQRNLTYSYLSKLATTMIDKECTTIMTDIIQDGEGMINLIMEGDRLHKLAIHMRDCLSDHKAATALALTTMQQKLSCAWSVDTSDIYKLILCSAVGVGECDDIDNMITIAETIQADFILDALPGYYILDAGFALGISI